MLRTASLLQTHGRMMMPKPFMAFTPLTVYKPFVLQPMLTNQVRTAVLRRSMKKGVFKRLIYRKGIVLEKNPLPVGQFGVFSDSNFVASKGMLECLRVITKRELTKRSVMYMKKKADIPRTKKGEGARMGKGKGGINDYVANIRKGSCIMEIKTEKEKTLRTILEKIRFKIPGRIYGYNKLTGKRIEAKKKKEKQ
ncbi:ribosomal protein mL16 [Acrasis kona]|uniref:Ribosomal protein mL16 n=1 Tax=Acrasis kona TaxID=1008807 RepID=A0AAW2Z4P0_9EUKA